MYIVFNTIEWILFMCIFAFGGFLYLSPNLLNFILLSEIIWINLYIFLILSGAQIDSAILISWALFILCLASAESAVGLSFLMFKFILYNQISDNYYFSLNNNLGRSKLNYTFLNYLND